MSTPVFMSSSHIMAMKELLEGEPHVLEACSKLQREYTIAYILSNGPAGDDVLWQMSFDPDDGVSVGLGGFDHCDLVYRGDWRAVMRAAAQRRRGEDAAEPFVSEGDDSVIEVVGEAFACAHRVAAIETVIPRV